MRYTENRYMEVDNFSTSLLFVTRTHRLRDPAHVRPQQLVQPYYKAVRLMTS